MRRCQLDRRRNHGWAVAHIDRNQGVAIGNTLEHLLHTGAANDEHVLVAAGLLDRLDGAQGNVVILGPHRLDVGETGQEILHHLEAVIAVPVGEFIVQNLDIGALDPLHEGVEALLVDRDRQAAQDDDVATLGQRLLEVSRRVGAQARIVACHIQVFHAGNRQLAVNDGDELAGILDLLDRRGHCIRIAGQNDEGVDIAGRNHVLDVGDLLGRIRGRSKHVFDIGIGDLEPVDRLLGEIVDAAGPAMVGRRH